MRINILRLGDEVISVTETFIAVRRANGEIDLIGLEMTDMGLRINRDHTITIGFGDGEVETETEDGVTITNF